MTMTNNNTTATNNAATKKITKKEYFRSLSNLLEKIPADALKAENTTLEALQGFIRREIELLDKKSGTKGNDALSKANVEITNTILKVLSELGKPVTISQLLEDSRLQSYKVGDETKKMSGQKLSALMTLLKNSGQVVRTEEKKKAYFVLAKK